MYYINSWEVYTKGLRQIIKQAHEVGKVEADDTVWYGPSGDAVVTGDPTELDGEYAEYVDSGEVSEYID